MRYEFDLETDLTPGQLFEYFETPLNWPGLFRAFAEGSEDPDGWIRVPIRRSPFVLKARSTRLDPPHSAAWDLRGFWKGDGSVSFSTTESGTRISGYEQVRPPRVFQVGGVFERWVAPRFEAVWESGWRHIRRQRG